MEVIDPRTFLVVATLLGFLCAMVLWVQAKSFPPDIEGLDHWAMAVVLIGASAGLTSLRGSFPDVIAVLLASVMVLLGELFLITGLLKFSRLRVRWRPALDGIIAVSILIAWLTWGAKSYAGETFIMALAHIVFFSLGAWYAWNAKPRGFGRRFLTAAFVLGVAVAAWRLMTLSVAAGHSTEIFEKNLIQQAYLGAFSLGVLGLSIGFVLLANERLREELEFLATRDPMTGAFNRRAFFARAEVEWARATRSKRPLSVIGSDIDFFKKVNDTYGHHIGDEVIKDFSRRAGAMLRVPDILARFGGEEFFILLPDTGLNEARQAAERIRREIEIRRNDKLPPYTVSLGIAEATWGAGSPADLDALLSKADGGLYKAKHGGRNRVEAG